MPTEFTHLGDISHSRGSPVLLSVTPTYQGPRKLTRNLWQHCKFKRWTKQQTKAAAPQLFTSVSSLSVQQFVGVYC